MTKGSVAQIDEIATNFCIPDIGTLNQTKQILNLIRYPIQ